MEIILDTKKIVAILTVFVLMAAGLVYLAVDEDEDTKPPRSTNYSVETDLDKMTWEDILEEARGQTVKVAALNDVGINAMLDNLVVIAKNSYGINVVPTYVAGFAAASENYNKGDVLETATADIYWMSCAAYGYQNYTDLWWNADWQSKLPSSIYLKDDTNDLIAEFIGDEDGYVGNQVEYSGAQLMLAYNTACQDVALPYDVVKVIDGATTKYYALKDNGTATANDACFDTADAAKNAPIGMSASTLKTFLTGLESAGKKFYYGLPSDYIELLEFAQYYEKQVTYPFINGSQYYVGYLFLTGAAYELENDGNGGFRKASDRATNVEKVNKVFSDAAAAEKSAIYIDDGVLKTYEGRLDYLIPYFDALDAVKSTNVSTKDGSNGYYNSANGVTDLNSMIVGKKGNTDIWSSESIMLGMTTLQSITMRQTGTYVNTGIYALDTTTSETYCWTIGKNSSNKAASLVLMEWFTGISGQSQLLEITGNPMNFDVEKYLNINGLDDGDYTVKSNGVIEFDDDVKDKRVVKDYNMYFGFIKKWAEDPEKKDQFVAPTTIAENCVVCSIAKYSAQLALLQSAI